jgi:hypothetical protein
MPLILKVDVSMPLEVQVDVSVPSEPKWMFHHIMQCTTITVLRIFFFWFLLLACILAIYIAFCFYSTEGFAKSNRFYSCCKQWFCMTVCYPSLLFPPHHFHYYSSQLLLTCSAYHQISLSLRSACCAVGSKIISSYFYRYTPNFSCTCFRGFLDFAQKLEVIYKFGMATIRF